MRLKLAAVLWMGAALLPLLAAAASDPAFAQLHWRSVGPAVSGGRVAAVAGTNRDSALYYAGAAGGGVWKSTNGGQSWASVFDDTGVAAIGAVTIDPNDSNTVWAGTGESNPRNDVMTGDGVYKSTDGAKTWGHVLPLEASLISAVLVDPRNSAHVLVGSMGDAFADSTQRGVYRTIDGGKTWSKVLYVGPSSGISDMVADPSDPNVVYAGMWQFRRTPWSIDSGGPLDGLYRSADGGATWTEVKGNGLPEGEIGRIAIAFAPSDPKRIYAIVQSKQGLLWRSDDRGATWRMMTADPIIDERPYYFSHIFVDPLNADRLWSDSVHLTISTDGGKTFNTTADALHGDHHAMWIASGGKRIIEGNDGGVGFSFDGGATWKWDNEIPVSQLYHVGYSYDDTYSICAPLQDNSTWCAPSNPLDPRGVSASQWLYTGVGGDGAWVVVDPHDRNVVWQSFGGSNNGGDVWIHNFANGETRSVAPYLRDTNVVPPHLYTHRFNWETPIAFDPFDARTVYVGGNRLLATQDAGYHWRARSGDLTRDIVEHQQITGGITLDVTGAETSDTILDIAPSVAARGQIWIGTDDGLVQLTRDAGAHWRDVTPPAIAPFGRFASISMPARDAATAYAIYDRHMLGDRTPYVFATHDYGAHWQSIAAGLPAGDEARSILVDPRNPKLLYLGLERSLWASWDAGATWTSITSDLPAASMRDIRLQPVNDDLLLATHGRGAYVLDDAGPLQQLDIARRAGTFLFPIRPAVLWNLNAYWNTATDGTGPPYGALVTYYLAAAAKAAPSAQIVDPLGKVVRTYATHDESGKTVPDLSNDAGLNRFAWDGTGQPAVNWIYAAHWNAGNPGITVPPGTYSLRLQVDGQTLVRPIVVRLDPRGQYSAIGYAASYALQTGLLNDFSHLDVALNVLSTVQIEAPLRAAALAANPALAAQVTAAGNQAKALIATISSDPANDQDNDFFEDVLRERLQSMLGTFTAFTAPTREQRRESAVLQALTRDRLAACAAFGTQIDALDVSLAAAHLPSLRHASAPPPPYGQRGEATEKR
jgi:photosystem II stability/assembly factor-like uncharacterized protein